MARRTIHTDNAPKAQGPYSQAVVVEKGAGSLIFVAGQLPRDPNSGVLITDDIAAATRMALNNIKAILEAAGASMRDVVRVEIFMADINQFAVVNEEYQAFFGQGPLPARQTVQVARLPSDSPIEISCIAALT